MSSLTDSDARPSRAEAALQTLNAFAFAMLEQHTLEDLLWSMARNIGTLLGFEDCVIYLREGNVLRQVAAYGVKNPRSRDIKSPTTRARGEGIAGVVWDTGESVIVADTNKDTRYIADEFPGRSELCVPIHFEGEILGVIDSESSEVDAFEESERVMLQSIANIASSRIAFALAERERAEVARRLEESTTQNYEALGQLAAGLAHDFNNSLTAVLGSISVARAQVGPGSSACEPLADALAGCARARDLATQLLTFARGGAPVRRPALISELIQEVTRSVLASSSARREVRVEAGLRMVEIDIGQITQVLTNLLLNADQAVGDGGTIVVAAKNWIDRPAGHEAGTPAVLVSVEDHGVGIDPEDLERVLDPYFTTKETSTGLGLTTSAWIVARHGGRLEVESNPGVGTTVHILLPASQEPAPVQPAKATASAPAGGRVLVMDDDEVIRRAITRMLSFLGYTATTAADGEEALRLYVDGMVTGEPFDVVILDLVVDRGLGGVDAVARLRELDQDARILVSSGYSNDPVMSQHAEYGFDGALGKPYDIEQLQQALALVLK